MKNIKKFLAVVFFMPVFFLVSCEKEDNSNKYLALYQYLQTHVEERSVGDLLLNDGTFINYSSTRKSITDEEKAKVIGVVFGFTEEKYPLILGIYNSSSVAYYSWAKKNTTGYKTYFKDIWSSFANSDFGRSFGGDKDGSDNLDCISKVDEAGVSNLAENYPAFNYASDYGTIYNLPEKYRTGWYLPSVYELNKVYENLAVLNTAIGLTNGNKIAVANYWSSSQGSERDISIYVPSATGGDDTYAWFVMMNSNVNESVGYTSKDASHLVCAVFILKPGTTDVSK